MDILRKIKKTLCLRLSPIHKADRIVVLDQGHIPEIGTYTQLLERKGVHARLQTQRTKKSMWVCLSIS